MPFSLHQVLLQKLLHWLSHSLIFMFGSCVQLQHTLHSTQQLTSLKLLVPVNTFIPFIFYLCGKTRHFLTARGKSTWFCYTGAVLLSLGFALA